MDDRRAPANCGCPSADSTGPHWLKVVAPSPTHSHSCTVVEPAALAFEINGQFLAANAGCNLTENPAVLDLAYAVLHRRLEG